MRIEIICTGDEVLTGKIVNTNFSYMSQKLEDFGLSVAWGTTVGDDREELLAAFRLSGARADAVIVNGGLGPTVDDLSQEIAARAAGVDLVLNEDWLQRMEDFFRRRNRVMSAIERKLAPVQAEVRKRLGNFIIAEDDQTLEGVVLEALAERDGSLAIVETFTSGQISARIAHLPGAEKVFRRAIVARDPAEIAAT